jgi:hypothetical protein
MTLVETNMRRARHVLLGPLFGVIGQRKLRS